MSKKYPTGAQKARLIARLEADPILRSGKFSSTFSKKEGEKRWEDIAQELNSITGAKKSWEGWRKTWQDMKSCSKKKNTAIRRAQHMTGGGTPPPPLSEEDLQILNTMSNSSLSGHQDSQESAVKFEEVVVPPSYTEQVTPKAKPAWVEIPLIKLNKQKITKIMCIAPKSQPDAISKVIGSNLQFLEPSTSNLSTGPDLHQTKNKENRPKILLDSQKKNIAQNQLTLTEPSTSNLSTGPDLDQNKNKENRPKHFAGQSKKNIAQNQLTLTSEFLKELKLKNSVKKEFYDSYIIEMRRQTEVLMRIANTLEDQQSH